MQGLRLNQSSPSASFSTASGIPGTLVTVSLTGYNSTDTSCTISGTPVYNPTSCTLSGGSGTLTFTVKQYTPAGTFIITVTGNPTSDSSQTSFQVVGLSFSLSPTSAAVGAKVTFRLSDLPSNDTSCSISSQGNVITVPACVVSNGSGSGTFVIGNVAPGDYLVEITACTGNNGCPPSAGDFSQAVLTVESSPTPSILLSASSGTPGTTIQVTGKGFSNSDTSCDISGTAVGSVSCSISDGALSGSFVIQDVSVGFYTVTATGSTGDFVSVNVGVAPTTTPAIRGFPPEAILSGLLLGLAAITLLRRKRTNRS